MMIGSDIYAAIFNLDNFNDYLLLKLSYIKFTQYPRGSTLQKYDFCWIYNTPSNAMTKKK